MKTGRLPWLLGAMLILALLRWWVPPRAEGVDAAPEVVGAVDRKVMPQSMPPEPQAPSVRRDAVDVAGNAFAVRVAAVVAPPKPPPPPPPPPKAKAFVGPPAPEPYVPPPPPPPPPVQVIGTWDDGKAPGVFMATAQGAVLARVGTVLLSEFRVTALTPQQVTLTHTTSRHEWRLAVPRAGTTP